MLFPLGHSAALIYGAVEWAVAKGYINGMTATTLAPMAFADRAQAATVLYRYLNR